VDVDAATDGGGKPSKDEKKAVKGLIAKSKEYKKMGMYSAEWEGVDDKGDERVSTLPSVRLLLLLLLVVVVLVLLLLLLVVVVVMLVVLLLMRRLFRRRWRSCTRSWPPTRASRATRCCSCSRCCSCWPRRCCYWYWWPRC